jgi:DNA-binding NtrC family response regulator
VRGRILVIDRDMEILSAAIRSFRPAGLYVDVAFSYEGALSHLFNSRPDVIMIDPRMSGNQGHQIISLIQQDPYLSEIPIVFLIDEYRWWQKQYSQFYGSGNYILKPPSWEYLIKSMKEVLEDNLRRESHEDMRDIRMRVLRRESIIFH